jgi:hypothetical protein
MTNRAKYLSSECVRSGRLETKQTLVRTYRCKRNGTAGCARGVLRSMRGSSAIAIFCARSPIRPRLTEPRHLSPIWRIREQLFIQTGTSLKKSLNDNNAAEPTNWPQHCIAGDGILRGAGQSRRRVNGVTPVRPPYPCVPRWKLGDGSRSSGHLPQGQRRTRSAPQKRSPASARGSICRSWQTGLTLDGRSRSRHRRRHAARSRQGRTGTSGGATVHACRAVATVRSCRTRCAACATRGACRAGRRCTASRGSAARTAAGLCEREG